jgi:two-component system sensor histidine kinase CpxA
MSVFTKIFVSFWLALIVTILLTAVMRPVAPPRAPFRESMFKLLNVHAHAILQDLDKGHQPEAEAAVNTLAQASGIHLFLFDNNGNEVTGQNVPGEVRLAIADKNEDLSGDNHIISRQIADDDGRTYTMAALFPPPVRPFFERPSFLLPRFAILFVVSGIVCFVLAHYMTAPLVRLRGAAQQFARGELHARADVPGARNDEIALLVKDFNGMAEQIEKLITAQRRLLSDISHELRSPLARLSIATGILRNKTGPEATSTLDRVERETVRLDQLIGQLLTLSAFESGEQAVDKSEINLADLAAEVASDADFEARDRNCHVTFNAGAECMVEGDGNLLRSAIENVVRNALRYTSEGSTVEMALSVPSADAGKACVLSVRDHGPGIPDEHLSDIFRPFYRLADARDRQSGGVGLGLAISQRAVSLHGGDVSAANAPDGGLIVSITLPLRSATTTRTLTAQNV